MALPYAQMILLPGHRAIDDLLIYALVRNEGRMACPFLKVEQLTEEFESLLFAHDLEADDAAQMRFKDLCRLLKLNQ